MAPAQSLSMHAPDGLGLAIVLASSTPLVLMDPSLTVRAASGSFCTLFDLDPNEVSGRKLLDLGAGEWNLPRLRSLLTTTMAGSVAIDAYELDLQRPGRLHHLVLNAQRLAYGADHEVGLLLAIVDVSASRLLTDQKDDLIRQKQVLLQELQHRVANSLQIIASVLMLGARRVQSEEARSHLQEAHERVMAVARLQKHLTTSTAEGVALAEYLTTLCASIGASMILEPEHLKLSIAVDDTVFSAEASVSMGLIVTELVINALKHAFPDHKAGGEIHVTFRSLAKGWLLQVTDNGVGRSQDAPPGLGTSIVEALAKQLQATVTVTAAHPGTSVMIKHLAAARAVTS